MTAAEAKRHLLNHMQYSHTYLKISQGEISEVSPRTLCEMASHAMACMWALVDALTDGSLSTVDMAEALEGIATRWIAACEKWSMALPSNQSRAYAAPIAERRALNQWNTEAWTASTSGRSDQEPPVRGSTVVPDGTGKPTGSS